jgi:hypothetical protein
LTALINNILFPAVLFIVYSVVASFVIREIECESLAFTSETTAYSINLHTIDRECLQMLSIKDLKAISSELNVIPAGNKSYKNTWVEAIISTELDLTILPSELVKLVSI